MDDATVQLGRIINNLFKMIGASSWDDTVLQNIGVLSLFVIFVTVVVIFGIIISYFYFSDDKKQAISYKNIGGDKSKEEEKYINWAPYGRIATVTSLAGFISIFLGIGLIVAGWFFYEPTFNGMSQLLSLSLYCSLPILALLLFMSFLEIKKRFSDGSVKKAFFALLLACSIGFSLTGWGVYIFTNGYLDTGKETKRIQTVTRKFIIKTRGVRASSGIIRHYYIDVTSWRSDVPKVTIVRHADADFYKSVNIGDKVELITKPGYWNIEWQASEWQASPQN